MRLFLVLPCYNEEEVLPETARRLKEKMSTLVQDGTIAENSRVLFVNDGSSDTTWEIISSLHEEDPLFQGLCLSRNRGHQNALLAGLMTVRELADVCISMDADLQDDIDAIDGMLEKYRGGADIVYGVRSDRKKDSFFKRFTARRFYKTMRSMGAETVYDHADFRLMSARALAALSEFGEVNLFLRGLVPLVGFRSEIVYYERGERFAGESKYPLGKMLHFATEGITSLSVKPIRLITRLGFLILLVAVAVAIYSLVRYFAGQTVPGWTTIVLSIWGIGGLIMISLGVIGEYIGKIYLETKHRPRYVIESYLKDETDEADLRDPGTGH
ncbi:MAG: glycosyltransferase family 2 protein [Lachnospiraceae bacterium]|nr:glycosyltransferase family 2 protein [Lachnospiraceae bacterium]